MVEKQTKRCSSCKQQWPLTEFHRCKTSTDGLQGLCKECNRENSRRQRLRSRENLLEQQKQWNAQNADRLKSYKAEYYQQHRQEIRDQARARYNAEYALNPGKYLAKCHARRVALYDNGGRYTEQEWLDLCAKYGNICLWCDRKTVLTVDHIVPICRGGSNDISNIQPLCRRCNSEKGTRIMNFRRQHDYFIENFLQDT
jgi:5-methylcytosine-specific restriction endonuclease McrA